jgi:hypothetical protein
MSMLETIITTWPGSAAVICLAAFVGLAVFRKNSWGISSPAVFAAALFLFFCGAFLYFMTFGHYSQFAHFQAVRFQVFGAIAGAVVLLYGFANPKQADLFLPAASAAVIVINLSFFQQEPLTIAMSFLGLDFALYAASLRDSGGPGRAAEALGHKLLYLSLAGVFLALFYISGHDTKAFRLGLNGFIFSIVMSTNLAAYTLSPPREPAVKNRHFAGLNMLSSAGAICQVALIAGLADKYRNLIMPGFYAAAFGLMLCLCAFRSITEEKYVNASAADFSCLAWLAMTLFMSSGISAEHMAIFFALMSMQAVAQNEYLRGHDPSRFTVTGLKSHFERFGPDISAVLASVSSITAEIFIIWQAASNLPAAQSARMALIICAFAYLPAVLNRTFLFVSMAARFRIDTRMKVGFNISGIKLTAAAAVFAALIAKW